ncbi:amine oxidase [Plakobranchus ocellatus]|uniref:Amine oxidase n=1 Tax=Plakobranchus ocellatus TaxID=259542 RepID=A0AAV3XXB3_9GAST|nr:amine oxidase [Plakobranchus ocellatus]
MRNGKGDKACETTLRGGREKEGAALTRTTLALWESRSSGVEDSDDKCIHKTHVHPQELLRGDINPFSELTQREIESVVEFLHAQTWLNLTQYKAATVDSNYIHLIEAFLPPKQEVLGYLDGVRPPPTRKARVFVFRPSEQVVEEYLVEPLPHPQNISLMKSNTRKTKIPFSHRPFTKYEFKAMYQHVLPVINKKAGHLIQESYNASLMKCNDRCLRFSLTPVSSGFLEPGCRKVWLWFAYDIEFYTLHPLDLQLLVDMTDINPENWEVQRVFYANRLFDSLDDLVIKYRSGVINKTRTQFPDLPVEEQFSAVYMRGQPVPAADLPPPQQIQPSGPRYTLEGNLLQYMDWRFNLRISPTVGTQLFDVRYKNERVLYELSMQEIAVLYSANSPAPSMLYFADGAGLFGTRMRGMMPGVDCPDYGTMLDVLVYTSNEKGLKRLENSLCIFEHSTETPLRRHRTYGQSGAFFTALSDQVLILRMYLCIINYDYVFDFIFHNNGAIEVKVSSTGYLAASFYYPEEEKYGTRISETVVAGMHHHLFHFKADLDIKGTSNRFETWNIGTETKMNKWADNPAREHTQNYFYKDLKSTEKEALYSFNFEHPKNLLFSKNTRSSLGHTPAYRLIHNGLTKTLLPEGVGFEPSVSWARYQMAVTRQHDDEIASSSIFAMWDANDPVVCFEDFYNDDEDIVDQDLVAWVTLGTYHIPQTENVPNTATVGTTQSFFLVPFNYHHEDPSLNSRDSVKIMPLDKSHPFSGAHVDRYNISLPFNCTHEQIDQDLLDDSRFLFS